MFTDTNGAVESGSVAGVTAYSNRPAFHAQREERLAFTVRLVRNDNDLAKAVQVRHAAYARHMPEFAEKLRTAESIDSEPGVTVLLAQSKLDGAALGTLRIQSNAYRPLTVEQSVTLPRWCHSRLAERTGSSRGRLTT